ncbi:hypothetical protein SAMN05216302_100376 [Nitrosomonas aestuarii]|uniref:Lipoprotein n=1 Tax=Nitrosomonas aestuarii TaxID=52441 RepID=A0A1I3Y8J3_9PROT|nr:hypothetical protein [Nitrosomonas aestuarii]SFK28030.1 hypothetical protein SAMN05216302_100376 [Nitrosomonas aestuarii]
MKNRLIIVTILTASLAACAAINSKDKPLRYEETVSGGHTALAYCVADKLNADVRWLMQLYHYIFRIYPDIETSQIYAYDTRFLPYIYSSNSPQNPDAIREYVNKSPEILLDVKNMIPAEYVYGFVLTIKNTSSTMSVASMKGDKYVSRIAWDYLQKCASTEN